MAEIPAGDISRDFFIEHYFNPRIPVLLKGAASHWELMTKWSVEYLIETMGDHQCAVSQDSRPAHAKNKGSLRDYFSARSGVGTLTYTPFDQGEPQLPGFFRDIPLPNPYFSKEDIAGFAFFHADDNSGTLPHCHLDAFNILHKGVKRWALYDAAPDTAPQGWEMLKRCFREYPAGTHAKDWFAEGLVQLGQEGVAVHECRQEAGDIVFIPEYFSHAVLNLSEVQGLVVQRSRQPERQYQPMALEEAFSDVGIKVTGSRHGV